MLITGEATGALTTEKTPCKWKHYRRHRLDGLVLKQYTHTGIP